NFPDATVAFIRTRANACDHLARGIDCEHLDAPVGSSQRRATAASPDIDQPAARANAEAVERLAGEGKAKRLEDSLVDRNVIVPARRLLVRLKACGSIHCLRREKTRRECTSTMRETWLPQIHILARCRETGAPNAFRSGLTPCNLLTSAAE